MLTARPLQLHAKVVLKGEGGRIKITIKLKNMDYLPSNGW